MSLGGIIEDDDHESTRIKYHIVEIAENVNPASRDYLSRRCSPAYYFQYMYMLRSERSEALGHSGDQKSNFNCPK